ncbi:hypothetical protein DFJ74DRAFT_495127 [Hyaloraphidium curvatum]|nr:hypothetical protein DFJ74DRAFT_495127 [Hyaloraphidium curvatum]
MSESVADFRLAPPRFINTTPRDAISFEWVHACVREGVRVATEDHLIRGSRNKVSGSNRTPFTRDDDVLLIDLAMKGKLGEGKKAGNKAFQDLAEKYPHHSAQAWRERWVKHLQPEVGRQLEKERREAKDRERAERAAQGEGLDAEEEPEGQDDADGEEEEVPRRRLPQTVRQQGDRRTRQPFTEEDDDILIERCNVPGKRDTKGNEIFKAIEAEVGC